MISLKKIKEQVNKKIPLSNKERISFLAMQNKFEQLNELLFELIKKTEQRFDKDKIEWIFPDYEYHEREFGLTIDEGMLKFLKKLYGHKFYAIFEGSNNNENNDNIAELEGNVFASYRDFLRDNFKKLYETDEREDENYYYGAIINDLGKLISIITFGGSSGDIILIIQK